MKENKSRHESRLMAEIIVDLVMKKPDMGAIKPFLIRDALNEALQAYLKNRNGMVWKENVEEGKLICNVCRRAIFIKRKASIEFHYIESDGIEKITNLITLILAEARRHIGEKHL